MLHLNKNNIPDLEKIADKHCSELKTSIIANLDEAIKKRKTPKNRKAFYRYLKKHIEIVLKGEPDELLSQIIEYAITHDLNFQKEDELLNIFFYKDYDTWGAYKLAKALNISSCCYCNRQYTITIGDDANKGVRPQFDHFFPKSKYPYLALSFYNLIPSCPTCNSSLKGSTDFDLEKNIHPYKEGFEENTRFTTVPACYEDIVGITPPFIGKELQMKLILRLLENDVSQNTKIRNNIEAFRLEEVYTEHADYIRDLIRLKVISNTAYMQDIAKLYDGLFDSEEELYRLIFGNYMHKEEFTKRPMAKLTRDILEGLGIYQKK